MSIRSSHISIDAGAQKILREMIEVFNYCELERRVFLSRKTYPAFVREVMQLVVTKPSNPAWVFAVPGQRAIPRHQIPSRKDLLVKSSWKWETTAALPDNAGPGVHWCRAHSRNVFGPGLASTTMNDRAIGLLVSAGGSDMLHMYCGALPVVADLVDLYDPIAGTDFTLRQMLEEAELI